MSNQPEDLRPYRKYGLTLLQLMALLASIGIVTTVVLSFFS